MLTQVAEGVLVHQSAFVMSNAVVVQGAAGVLLVDPGITVTELDRLAHHLEERRGGPVVAGFSTHPDWDHVLWHPRLGAAPRYATALGAGTVRDLLADPGTLERVGERQTLVRLTAPGPGILTAFAYGEGDGTATAGVRAYLFSAGAAEYVRRAQPAWQAWLDGLVVRA